MNGVMEVHSGDGSSLFVQMPKKKENNNNKMEEGKKKN